MSPSEEHVMIDLETLGTRPGSMIVSIGACIFSLENGIGETHYQIINASSGSFMTPPMMIDPETVKWWMKQSDEARSIFNDDDRMVPLAEALMKLDNWLADVGSKYVWGHGASFDPVLLDAAFFACGRKTPWSHKTVRDTRTVFELANVSAADFPAVVKHNALDDAISQALAVIEAHKRLGRPLG